jgi:hypothetical protein
MYKPRLLSRKTPFLSALQGIPFQKAVEDAPLFSAGYAVSLSALVANPGG